MVNFGQVMILHEFLFYIRNLLKENQVDKHCLLQNNVDLKGKTWINFCQFSASFAKHSEKLSHNWGILSMTGKYVPQLGMCRIQINLEMVDNIDNYDKCIATLKWIINYNVQLVQSTQTVEKCDIIFIAAGFCFLPICIYCLWYLFYFSCLIFCIVVLFSVCIVCDIYYIFHFSYFSYLIFYSVDLLLAILFVICHCNTTSDLIL